MIIDQGIDPASRVTEASADVLVEGCRVLSERRSTLSSGTRLTLTLGGGPRDPSPPYGDRAVPVPISLHTIRRYECLECPPQNYNQGETNQQLWNKILTPSQVYSARAKLSLVH